jgi:hypothetical protein
VDENRQGEGRRVAVLGWGSLIAEPGVPGEPDRFLRLRSRWNDDGPMLPVEFARISCDGRLTLVICPPPVGASVRTYWALSAAPTLVEARQHLQAREGTVERRIGWLDAETGRLEGLRGILDNGFRERIADGLVRWAREKAVDAVIWTDLTSNFPDRVDGKPFNVTNAVGYLQRLEGNEQKLARHYFEIAPEQTDTPVRREVERILGWRPLASGSSG